MKVNDVIKYIEKQYPLNSMLDFDNSGANIVSFDDEVKKILVCLDISKGAIDYAVKNDVNLIISHHPIIFNEFKNINDDTLSRKIRLLISNQINAYSVHTNFDANIKYGMGNAVVKKAFAKMPILKNTPFDEYYVGKTKYGIGNYITFTKNYTFDNIKDVLIKNLDLSADKIACYDITNNKKIKNLIIIPGSGSSDVEKVILKKPDLLITSDLKHNQIIDLIDNDISYINATHYGLEKVFIEYFSDFLSKRFKNIIIKYYENNL